MRLLPKLRRRCIEINCRSQARAEFIEAQPADFAVDDRRDVVAFDTDVAQLAIIEALQIHESQASTLTDMKKVQCPGEKRGGGLAGARI
jgi:hypothetical protein